MVTIENNKGDMEEKLTDHGDSSCTEDEFLLSQPTEEGEETQSTVEGKEAETAKAASRTRPPYEIFPWLKEVHRAVRTNLKCEYSQRNLLNVMDKCIKHLKEEIPSYLRLPNKSLILSKHITRLLILFKYLNRNFDESTEYLLRMSELLGYYTQLELKYSTKFEESRHLVANRICLHYDLLLQGAQESYILRIFLQVKNCFNQKEVMRKIYEKYLKKPRAQKSELADKLFVMYLVSYKLWKNLEDDKEEQLKIDDYANNFMKPKSSLRTNPNFAPFIPSYKAKSEDATRCILSEHFNTNSLIQAVKKDDIIDNTEKNLGNIVDLSICDDLPLTDFLKSENDNSCSILLSKTIKLEKPEVIATIDLTAEEKIRAREICWLESLRRKARAAEPIHIPNRCCTTQQSNVIAVIDLDDDEDQVEDVEMRDETNLNAKDVNDENLVSTNLENISNISENKKNCESFKLPESPALKESVSLDGEGNEGTNIKDHENLEDEVVPKQSIIQEKNVVSEIAESSVVIEKNQDSSDKISIPELSVKEASAKNHEEDLSTSATLPTLEANCDILVNDNNSMQVETLLNQEITLSNISAGQDDAINVSGTKKDTSPSSDTEDGTSETESLREDKQTEMKQQKLANELEKSPIEHLAESDEKTSPLSERNDLCDDADELVSLKNGINAVSCTSSEKMQEKIENSSTEEINKEIGTETTTNCPSPCLEVPQSKEQCSSVTKSKDLNDQILTEHDTKKGGEAYDSSKLFDDDDFFKDFTENLATKNPMCKTYQRKKKSAAPNIPVLTIPPVKDSTMLDLPAFSPPSSSECNDDSRDSNSLSILEESEPIDDENFEILLGKPVEIDDTPIEKISPTKVFPSSKPTNASNVVFSMSSNRKISLPPPKEELLPPISSMSSNVVFSTGKQFPTKIDLASSSGRRDSILDDWNEHREELFEENTNSTSTSLLEIDNDEIASPTMEQFTNSDVVDVAQFFGKVTIPPKNIKETITNTDDKIVTEDIPSQNLSEELKTTIAKTDRITSILNSNAKSRTEFRDTCSSSPLPSVTKKKSVSFVDSPQRKASASIIYPKESIILEKKTYIKPFSINATEPLESWESSINTQITSPSSNQHDVAVKSSCSPRITVRSTWPTANSSPNFEDTVVWSPSSRAKRWHVGKSQVSLYKKANLNNTFKNKLKYMDGPSKLYTHSVQMENPLKNIHYKVVNGVKIKMVDFEEKLFNCMVVIKRADEISYYPTDAVKVKRVEKGNSDFDKYLMKKKSIEAAKKTKLQYSPRKVRKNKNATINSTPKRKYVKKSFLDKYGTDDLQKSYSMNRNTLQIGSRMIFGTEGNETFHNSEFNFLNDEKLRKRVEVQLRNIAMMKEYRKFFTENEEQKQNQSPTYCRKARSLCDMKNVSNSAAVFKNEAEKDHFAKKEHKKDGPRGVESCKVTARRRSDSDTVCNYDRTSSASKLFIQVFKKAVENEKSTKPRIEEISFHPREQNFLSPSPFELPEKLLCDDDIQQKLDESGPNISFEFDESSKYFNRNKAGHIEHRESLPMDDEYIQKNSETRGANILEKSDGYDTEACCSLFSNVFPQRRDTRDCEDYGSLFQSTKFGSDSNAGSVEFLVRNAPLPSPNFIEPNEVKTQSEENLRSMDGRKQNAVQNTKQINQSTTNSTDNAGNVKSKEMEVILKSSTAEIINSGYTSNDNEVSSTTQQIGRVRTRRKTVASGWNEITSADVPVTPTQKKRKVNELEPEISGSGRDNAPTTTTTIVKPARRRRKSKAIKSKPKQLELSHTDTETDEQVCSPVLIDQQRLVEINIPSNTRKGSDEEKHIGASETVNNPYSVQSISLEVNRTLSESPEDLNVNANIRQTYSKNSFIQNVFVPPDVEEIIELSQNNIRQQNEEVKDKKTKSGKSRRKREFNC